MNESQSHGTSSILQQKSHYATENFQRTRSIGGGQQGKQGEQGQQGEQGKVNQVNRRRSTGSTR